MPKLSQKDIVCRQAGVIPLIVLIIAGVIAVVGGIYIIRNNLLKLNNITDSAKLSDGQQSAPPKLAPKLADKPFTYNPPQNTLSNTQSSKEPTFTITPPASWANYTGGDGDANYIKFMRANFTAPEEDKIEIDPVTKAFLRFPALIEVLIAPADHNLQLQELIDGANEDVRKTGSTLISSKEITVSGIRGYSQELKIPFKDVILTKRITGTEKEERGSLKESAWRHQIINIFAVNNFSVYVKGAALEQAWSEKVDTIKASMDSFTLEGGD